MSSEEDKSYIFFFFIKFLYVSFTLATVRIQIQFIRIFEFFRLNLTGILTLRYKILRCLTQSSDY
jgi:hypothetical protein